MAGVVTGVGGVFVGLTATRASAHADLANNGWFVASLVITICGVVALMVISVTGLCRLGAERVAIDSLCA